MSFGGGPQPRQDEVARDVQLPTKQREWTTQRELPDGTKVVWTTLKGKKSGFTGRVWAWVPKQYDDPKYKKSAFPVLTALPGSVGYPTNYWFSKEFKFPERMGEGVESGKSLPFIVVMPVLNADKKHYYDGSDIPNQPKMGSWMSDDVPDLVKENFRTYKDPKGWGFFGSSSGGYVGMKMVLQHPDRFSVAVAGGTDTEPDSELWRGHEREKKENSPAFLASQLSRKGGPEVHLSFLMGNAEPRKNVEKFRQKITAGPVKTKMQIVKGSHSGYAYADGFFAGELEWMSKLMRGPVAGGS
ncbi:alpha/beta hydrolase-fold protein [Streptomyces sp. NPDC007100]|uniref:alpha/beta hydrolase n=1 Tax=unclassified Streptomyces TaxID=2593676 RepID=UPI0034021BDE